MADHTLRSCRVLVVEDEYMLADELRLELDEVEAIVLGPAGTVEDAQALIEAEQRIDGAILDINLHGEMAFPVADLLHERGVPFVFTTGYDETVIPPRFAKVTRCEKPVNIAKITRAIGRAIHSEATAD